jgi:hypothetical protein
MYRKTTPVWLSLFAARKRARVQLSTTFYAIVLALLIGGKVLAALASQIGNRHDAPVSIDPSALTREAGDLPVERVDSPF